VLGGPGPITPDGEEAIRRGWGPAIEALIARWRELDASGEMKQARADAVTEEVMAILDLVEEAIENPSPEMAIGIAERLDAAEDDWAISVARKTIDIRDRVEPAVAAADRFIESAGDAAGRALRAVGEAADTAMTVLKIGAGLFIAYQGVRLVRATTK
jgi:hypothetical protein